MMRADPAQRHIHTVGIPVRRHYAPGRNLDATTACQQYWQSIPVTDRFPGDEFLRFVENGMFIAIKLDGTAVPVSR